MDLTRSNRRIPPLDSLALHWIVAWPFMVGIVNHQPEFSALTYIILYLILTVILSLIGWTRLGREVRGRFLVLRQEDYVLAAELMGASRASIIRLHLVPTITSHVIATATLALPAMIIAETSLSFLGLGLRPPAISWGILLQGAQQVQVLALRPWLLAPAIPVVVAILAFNFVGDGLRDAADPYSRRT